MITSVWKAKEITSRQVLEWANQIPAICLKMWHQNTVASCPSENHSFYSRLDALHFFHSGRNMIRKIIVDMFIKKKIQFSPLAQLCPTLWPHGLQHARLPCPSPTPGVHSNSCPLDQWCHPTISSSVVPFSSCLKSFPASGSFPRSQFFASHGQSIGVSASALVLPMKIQDWYPLGWAITQYKIKTSKKKKHH